MSSVPQHIYEKLQSRSIHHHPQTLWLVAGYVGIRLFSFLTAEIALLQAILVFILLLTLGFLYFKNEEYAWMMIIAELFLGGAGHYFEFYGLSIRTLLILTFLLLWISFTFLYPERKHRLKPPHTLFYLFIPLFAWITFASIWGLLQGHSIVAVIQDGIPFAFLLFLVPSYHLFKRKETRDFFVRSLIVFLVCGALYSLLIFVLFRSGAAELHDPFYNWIRDFGMGKITVVNNYFFRVVSPEHLLLTPLMLIVLSLLMRDEKHHHMWRILFICASVTLALSLSRAYILALIIALPVLFYKHRLKRSLIVSSWAVSILALSFVSISLLSSGFSSLGLDIVGLRGASITTPDLETSTATRMSLLRPINSLINRHPLIGNGIGAAFTYTDPLTNVKTMRRHFDWGYHELVAELGIIGTSIFLFTILSILIMLIGHIRDLADYHDLHVGILAALVSLLLITITTPALYHVFGIFFLVFTVSFITKKDLDFDHVVHTLYSVFHRAK